MAHRVTVLGQRLSYPAANVGAVVVVVLAVLGLSVVCLGLVEASREALSSLRITRAMRSLQCGRLEDAAVFSDARLRAFCAGLVRPRVYISTGVLEQLDERAVEAVLWHERGHARRRDPLRLATGRVLVRSLFFVPGLRELAHRHELLAELGADETAVNASPGGAAHLARAILGFHDAAVPGQAGFADPERIDHLTGELPSWRLPVLLWLGGVAVLALLLGLALLAGRAAAGSATLALPLLSDQPCVVVLALIPAAIGALVLRLRARSFAQEGRG